MQVDAKANAERSVAMRLFDALLDGVTASDDRRALEELRAAFADGADRTTAGKRDGDEARSADEAAAGR